MLYACQVCTQALSTTLPAQDGDRTVTGTYRCAPDSAASLSRYAPAGQSSVGTRRSGSQSTATMLVPSDTVAVRCAPPRTVFDFHSRRAPCPWYQPSRYAVTVNERAVVDTNSGSG